MNAIETYKSLKKKDTKLMEKAIELGLEAIAGDAINFARECAENYPLMRQNGLYEEAERLRLLSFCWSVKHYDATGDLRFFRTSSAA